MALESYRSGQSKINFKLYGAGPPLVLFHPSPNSSLMMHDLAVLLSKHFTVVCPDTPGYGRSPKLAVDHPSMNDYALAFHDLFKRLGFDSIACYGSATGAQIAIRYGILFPEHTSHLFLDNCAHFTDAEREQILANYFPDLTPSLDGQHLVRLWDMVSNLFRFFPWCFKDEDHQLSGPIPPPSVLHSIVQDYLQAGTDYDIAYRAAFDHEKVDYIQQLIVATTVLRWEGSILKKYTDRIFDHELPDNVHGQKISADRSLRYIEIVDHIVTTYKSKQEYSKDALIPKLIVDTEKISVAEFNTEPPKPDANGLYLIKAWHELRDQEFLNDTLVDNQEKQNGEALQRSLVSWFTNYKN